MALQEGGCQEAAVAGDLDRSDFVTGDDLNLLVDAKVETEIGKPTSTSLEMRVPDNRLWSPLNGPILMR